MRDMKLEIDVARERLHRLMSCNPEKTEEIVRLSEELDVLISEFNKMQEKGK